MPAHPKPGVDWANVRRLYETGEAKAPELARRYGVSSTAVIKRRDREGWLPPGTNAARQITDASHGWLERAKALGITATTSLRNPEAAARVAAAVERGLPDSIAAPLAGLSRSTLSAWQDEDPALSDLLEEAHAKWHAQHLGNINDASDRGDTQAAKWALERHSRSREHWKAADGAGGLTISVAFGFMAQPPQQVVDHASVITVDAVQDGAELVIGGPETDK